MEWNGNGKDLYSRHRHLRDSDNMHSYIYLCNYLYLNLSTSYKVEFVPTYMRR